MAASRRARQLMALAAERGGQAWISMASFATVLVYVVLLGWAQPDAAARAPWHGRVVFALGYGHLLASVAGRRRHEAASPLTHALAPMALLLCTYVLYVALCRVWPLLPLTLLGLSAWHTVENDRAIRRSSPDDAAPIGPIATTPRDVTIDAIAAAAISVAAITLPRVTPRIQTADIVAAFSLHHLVMWLMLVLARARARGRTGGVLVELVRLHVPMMLLCAGSVAMLDLGARMPAPMLHAAETILSPATYLFWSGAHVLHTAQRRMRGRASTAR